MTIEQRKISLINSITNLDNEGLLLRLQELIEDDKTSIPPEIMALVDKSNASKIEDRTEHTSVRDLIQK